MVDLLNWAYSDGQGIAIQEGYSKLPQALVVKILAKINTIQ